jgi:hypothetical protein
MAQDDNDRVNSSVEAETTKTKVESLDRTIGHMISTHRLGFSVVAWIFSLIAILAAVLIPAGNVMWNTLLNVDRTTAELRSEVAALRGSLGETPDKLERLLADIKEIRGDLERQVRQMDSNQQGLSRAASSVEVYSTSLRQQVGNIMSDLEVLKSAVLPPQKQVPAR